MCMMKKRKEKDEGIGRGSDGVHPAGSLESGRPVFEALLKRVTNSAYHTHEHCSSDIRVASSSSPGFQTSFLT